MADPPIFEIIAAGEILVDMIGVSTSSSLGETEHFKRFPGGSTANLANNLNLLGKRTALVASVGEDSLGTFLKRSMEKTGLSSTFVRSIPGAQTTIILVSKTTGTPEFIAYRSADYKISQTQLPESLLANARIFHTTCFGLSQSPAREVILEAAKRAFHHNATLSIDLNYAPQVWPDRKEALEIVHQYCQHKALVKVSYDDHQRLFLAGSPEDSIYKLLDMGAQMVCMTLGKKGCMLGEAGNSHIRNYHSLDIEVKGDATGAGDAFWSGFLSGFLDGLDPDFCVKAGMNVSALKLQKTGPLSSVIDLSKIYT